MENLDQQISNWVRIAKGDLPGHEFHGNQYQSFSARELADAIEAKGAGTDPSIYFDYDKNNKPIQNTATIAEDEKSLLDQAERHSQLADSHRSTIEELKSLITQHQEAADAHDKAAKVAKEVAESVHEFGEPVKRTGRTVEQMAGDAQSDGEMGMFMGGSSAINAASEAADASEAANNAPFKTVSTEAL